MSFSAVIIGVGAGILNSGIFKISEHEDIDPYFRPYVQYLYFIAGNRIGNVDKIGFYTDENEVSEETLGECSLTIPTLKPEIDISKKKWYTLNELERFFLIAHEMLHCGCKHFKHFNVIMQDGCPLHYSNGNIASTKCIDKHFSEYLFQVAQGCNGI